MELLFILLVIVPAALAVVLVAARSWTRITRWRTLAEDLAACLGPQTLIEKDSVHAVLHDSRLQVRRVRLGARRARLEIEIRADGVPPEIVLRRPRLEGRHCEHNAYATGDPFFDRNVIMEGPEDALYAVLGAEARRLAVVTLTGKFTAEVSGGAYRRHLVYVGSFDVFALAAELRPAADLMGRLRLGAGGVRSGLLEHLAHDSQAAVRASCLDALFRYHAGSAEALRALDLADADKSSRVRYSAALLRGAGGEQRLEDLLRAGDASISVRLDVVSELAARLEQPRLLDVLTQLLDEPDRELKLAAIQWMGRLEIPEASTRLAPLLDDPAPEVVAGASDALARIARANGTLIDV